MAAAVAGATAAMVGIIVGTIGGYITIIGFGIKYGLSAGAIMPGMAGRRCDCIGADWYLLPLLLVICVHSSGLSR